MLEVGTRRREGQALSSEMLLLSACSVDASMRRTSLFYTAKQLQLERVSTLKTAIGGGHPKDSY